MTQIRKKRFFYIIIFLFFLFLLFLSPISGDDWGNYEVGKLGVYHSIGNAIGMYFDWEGRFVSRILINILTYHKYLWNIINSFLIVLTIYFSIKIINPVKKKMIYLLVLLIILLMNVYTFSQTITWIAGNITYFFVIPIILGYFYVLIKNEKSTLSQNIFFLLINLFIPMFVEHMALVLVFGNICIFIAQYYKEKKWNRKLIIYILFSVMSTLGMLFSPGSRARSLMENLYFNELNLIEKIFYNLPNFVYYTFIVNSYMLILLTFGNYFMIKNNIKKRWLKIALLTIIVPLAIFTIILYPISFFYSTSLQIFIDHNNVFIIVLWLIYFFISTILLIMNSIKTGNFSSVFFYSMGIMANVFMLMSPTWGYRTSLFTVLCLSIVSLIIIDQYSKKSKSLYLKLIVLLVVSFYIILYINVAKCQSRLEKSIRKQLKENKKVIEIERFPYFINCNINPENDYHITKFKQYYHIPESKKIILTSKNWRYLIIYNP